MDTLLYRVNQFFPRPEIRDIPGYINSELTRSGISIGHGASIAIAVGSRGISNNFLIVKTIVEWLKAHGAKPFIVPSMGSHGGATAEGQTEILSGYGITELSVGAPIKSSMQVVKLGEIDSLSVYMDKNAFESDGVLLVNRIKPHTDFHDTFESGLVKMSVLGLGKHAQALEIHKWGIAGLRTHMPRAAQYVLKSGKVIGGIAIVENAYEQTAYIEAIVPENFLKREPQLLSIAKESMPKLPVSDIDILIIDKMGKNISGVGIDPNIIGRIRIPGEIEPQSPKIKCIIVSDLTDKSHGNALGVGLADVITKQLFSKINFAEMYENAFTSSFLERAKIPVIAQNDRDALRYALRTIGFGSCGRERIVRIKDTLQVAECLVSKTIIDELSGNPECKISNDPLSLLNNSNDFCVF